MKKRENNRGFTLVELVIAVAILAIAVAPLMANFIQSSRMNLKGRKSLNATNLGQAVMEGMSIYPVSELDEMMVSANTINLAQKILPPGTQYDSARKDVASSNENIYYYIIDNVRTTDGGYNAYDLKIKLDAMVDSTTNRNGYNKEEMATITELDQYYDAVYNVPNEELSAAFAELLVASSKHDKGYENYLGNMVRQMNIVIANEGTAAVPIYTVRVNNVYSVRASALDELGLDAGDVSVQNSGNISNTKSDRLPRSIYIYFEGMKNATTAEKLENIKVTNTTGLDIDVYLIRIQDEEADMEDYNNNFGCQVEVVSQNPDGSQSNNVNIVSNLRFNLNHPLENNYRATTESGAAIEDVDDTLQTFYSTARTTYTYNGVPMSEDDYNTYISDGYKKEKRNILYDVTIEIYETGTDKRVATYTGGLTD